MKECSLSWRNRVGDDGAHVLHSCQKGSFWNQSLKVLFTSCESEVVLGALPLGGWGR